MKYIFDDPANRAKLKPKHKAHDRNEDHKKIKREVEFRVPRRVESLIPESTIEDKGKFFKSVKQILLHLRFKDTLLRARNNYYVEKLTSRLKISQSQERQDYQENLEAPVEISQYCEDFNSQQISLYMPLQF